MMLPPRQFTLVFLVPALTFASKVGMPSRSYIGPARNCPDLARNRVVFQGQGNYGRSGALQKITSPQARLRAGSTRQTRSTRQT